MITALNSSLKMSQEPSEEPRLDNNIEMDLHNGGCDIFNIPWYLLSKDTIRWENIKTMGWERKHCKRGKCKQETAHGRDCKKLAPRERKESKEQPSRGKENKESLRKCPSNRSALGLRKCQNKSRNDVYNVGEGRL